MHAGKRARDAGSPGSWTRQLPRWWYSGTPATKQTALGTGSLPMVMLPRPLGNGPGIPRAWPEPGPQPVPPASGTALETSARISSGVFLGQMGHSPKCTRAPREGPTRSGKGRPRPGGPPHPTSWLCCSSPVARKWEGWTVRCCGAGLVSCLLHSPAGAPRGRLISPLSACSADGRGSRGTW